MATMSVWKFPTAKGAQNALDLVRDLKKQHLITLHDAAIVTWPEGKKKPKTKQLVDMASADALDGAFWGILFGLIFFIPLFGMAVGAAMGALAGAFTDVGIDDEFIKKVGSEVTEGTSALSGVCMESVLTSLPKPMALRTRTISTPARRSSFQPPAAILATILVTAMILAIPPSTQALIAGNRN